MAKLPVASGAEAVKAFQRAGRRVDRQKRKPRRAPQAGSRREPVRPPASRTRAGNTASIIRAAGMSVEDFAALL